MPPMMTPLAALSAPQAQAESLVSLRMRRLRRGHWRQFATRRAVTGVALAVVVLASCGTGGGEEVTCARDGVTLDEGIVLTDLSCGSAPTAVRGMTATVRYSAELADGGEISTGAGAGDTHTFRLGAGQVVPAWDIGLVGMGVGGERRIEAPSEYAYAEAGLYPDVPPDADVTFEVELLDLEEPPTE